MISEGIYDSHLFLREMMKNLPHEIPIIVSSHFIGSDIS